MPGRAGRSFFAEGARHLGAATLVGLATALGWLAGPHLELPDVVMVYLLAVVLSAARLGRGPSVVTASLSVAAFDFFFIPPRFSFAVADLRHVFTFAIMLVVGLVISGLTRQLSQQRHLTIEQETRTAILASLSRDLSAGLEVEQIAQLVVTHASRLLGGSAGIVLAAAPTRLAAVSGPLPFDATEQRQVMERLKAEVHEGADQAPGRVACVALRAGARPLGVLLLGCGPPGDELATRELVAAVVNQGSLALERARLEDEARVAALKVHTEQVRSSLLSAVSHDLRTPLATITGAASALRGHADQLPSEQRDELIVAISEEAARLERQVENLLDMTRLDSGAVSLKREWVPLDEMIGSALGRLDERLGTREVHVEVRPDWVSVDPVLLEQVFVNLLENAIKYTPAASPIEIRAQWSANAVEIEIADRGPGLMPGDERRIFEKFQRGHHPGTDGVGLGLAICKAIVETHGGQIRAENREAGGVAFCFSLVWSGAPPSLQESGGRA